MTTFLPGGSLLVHANHGKRRATILAIRGKHILTEYTMPGGTTALRIIDLSESGNTAGWGQRIPYADLSVPWLQAVVDAGQEWVGTPQQHRLRARPVPAPVALLSNKRFLQAFHRFWWRCPGPRFLKALQQCEECGEVTSWIHGGCWVVAESLQYWVERELSHTHPEIETILLVVAEYRRKPKHIVLAIRLESGDEVLLDSEGIRTREALLDRWERWHGLSDPALIAYDPSQLDDFAFDWDVCDDLALALGDYFGPFSLPLVFPAATGSAVPPLVTHHFQDPAAGPVR
jgi:hypothetical protein